MRNAMNVVNIENARLIFRNFKGAASKFNREGDRNFSIVLDQEIAQTLATDGWNVREKPATEDYPEAMYTLQVKVDFDSMYPPKVVMINSRGQQKILNKDNVAQLDYADVMTADLTIRPYCWEVGDKKGVKAYLKALYITIQEDLFAEKYAALEGPDEEKPFN